MKIKWDIHKSFLMLFKVYHTNTYKAIKAGIDSLNVFERLQKIGSQKSGPA